MFIIHWIIHLWWSVAYNCTRFHKVSFIVCSHRLHYNVSNLLFMHADMNLWMKSMHFKWVKDPSTTFESNFDKTNCRWLIWRSSLNNTCCNSEWKILQKIHSDILSEISRKILGIFHCHNAPNMLWNILIFKIGHAIHIRRVNDPIYYIRIILSENFTLQKIPSALPVLPYRINRHFIRKRVYNNSFYSPRQWNEMARYVLCIAM